MGFLVRLSGSDTRVSGGPGSMCGSAEWDATRTEGVRQCYSSTKDLRSHGVEWRRGSWRRSSRQGEWGGRGRVLLFIV